MNRMHAITQQISTSTHDLSSGQHGGHVVKLADFGMSGVVRSDGCLRGRCGTPGYVRWKYDIGYVTCNHRHTKLFAIGCMCSHAIVLASAFTHPVFVITNSSYL